MEEVYVYIYKRGGNEYCTPSYRLAYARSEDNHIQAIALNGSLVDLVND